MTNEETLSGSGLLRWAGGEVVPVRYQYSIDRRNRVWHGLATRLADDGSDAPLVPAAGPAEFETEAGQRAAISYYQRQRDGRIEIVFTGRGAPPGEET